MFLISLEQAPFYSSITSVSCRPWNLIDLYYWPILLTYISSRLPSTYFILFCLPTWYIIYLLYWQLYIWYCIICALHMFDEPICRAWNKAVLFYNRTNTYCLCLERGECATYGSVRRVPTHRQISPLEGDWSQHNGQGMTPYPAPPHLTTTVP